MRAIGKHHAVAGARAIGDLLRVAARVHLHAQALDLGLQHPAAAFVHLHRHQAGGELHHMGFQAHIAQGLGAFQPQQAAANHHARAGLGPCGLHGFQVFDGAVHKAVRAVAPRHLGHEGVGACGQHELVVRHDFAILCGDGIGAPVNAGSARGQPQRKAGALEKAGLHQRQLGGRFAAEEFGEVNAVVRGAGFFAQHRDLHAGDTGLGQALQKLVAHHSVANENNLHACNPAMARVSGGADCSAPARGDWQGVQCILRWRAGLLWNNRYAGHGPSLGGSAIVSGGHGSPQAASPASVR